MPEPLVLTPEETQEAIKFGLIELQQEAARKAADEAAPPEVPVEEQFAVDQQAEDADFKKLLEAHRKATLKARATGYVAGERPPGLLGKIPTPEGVLEAGKDVGRLVNMAKTVLPWTTKQTPQEKADEEDAAGALEDAYRTSDKASGISSFAPAARGAVRSMVPAMATGGIMGAAGLGAGAIMAGQAAVGGGIAADQAYEKAIQAGKTPEEAFRYGLIDGVLEGGVSALFSKFGLGGTEKQIANLFAGDAVKAVEKSLAREFGLALKDLPKDVAAELLEELTTTIGQGLNQIAHDVDVTELDSFDKVVGQLSETTKQTLLQFGMAHGLTRIGEVKQTVDESARGLALSAPEAARKIADQTTREEGLKELGLDQLPEDQRTRISDAISNVPEVKQSSIEQSMRRGAAEQKAAQQAQEIKDKEAERAFDVTEEDEDAPEESVEQDEGELVQAVREEVAERKSVAKGEAGAVSLSFDGDDTQERAALWQYGETKGKERKRIETLLETEGYAPEEIKAASQSFREKVKGFIKGKQGDVISIPSNFDVAVEPEVDTETVVAGEPIEAPAPVVGESVVASDEEVTPKVAAEPETLEQAEKAAEIAFQKMDRKARSRPPVVSKRFTQDELDVMARQHEIEYEKLKKEYDDATARVAALGGKVAAPEPVAIKVSVPPKSEKKPAFLAPKAASEVWEEKIATLEKQLNNIQGKKRLAAQEKLAGMKAARDRAVENEKGTDYLRIARAGRPQPFSEEALIPTDRPSLKQVKGMWDKAAEERTREEQAEMRAARKASTKRTAHLMANPHPANQDTTKKRVNEDHPRFASEVEGDNKTVVHRIGDKALHAHVVAEDYGGYARLWPKISAVTKRGIANVEFTSTMDRLLYEIGLTGGADRALVNRIVDRFPAQDADWVIRQGRQMVYHVENAALEARQAGEKNPQIKMDRMWPQFQPNHKAKPPTGPRFNNEKLERHRFSFTTDGTIVTWPSFESTIDKALFSISFRNDDRAPLHRDLYDDYMAFLNRVLPDVYPERLYDMGVELRHQAHIHARRQAKSGVAIDIATEHSIESVMANHLRTDRLDTDATRGQTYQHDDPANLPAPQKGEPKRPVSAKDAARALEHILEVKIIPAGEEGQVGAYTQPETDPKVSGPKAEVGPDVIRINPNNRHDLRGIMHEYGHKLWWTKAAAKGFDTFLTNNPYIETALRKVGDTLGGTYSPEQRVREGFSEWYAKGFMDPTIQNEMGSDAINAIEKWMLDNTPGEHKKMLMARTVALAYQRPDSLSRFQASIGSMLNSGSGEYELLWHISKWLWLKTRIANFSADANNSFIWSLREYEKVFLPAQAKGRSELDAILKADPDIVERAKAKLASGIEEKNIPENERYALQQSNVLDKTSFTRLLLSLNMRAPADTHNALDHGVPGTYSTGNRSIGETMIELARNGQQEQFQNYVAAKQRMADFDAKGPKGLPNPRFADQNVRDAQRTIKAVEDDPATLKDFNRHIKVLEENVGNMLAILKEQGRFNQEDVEYLKANWFANLPIYHDGRGQFQGDVAQRLNVFEAVGKFIQWGYVQKHKQELLLRLWQEVNALGKFGPLSENSIATIRQGDTPSWVDGLNQKDHILIESRPQNPDEKIVFVDGRPRVVQVRPEVWAALNMDPSLGVSPLVKALTNFAPLTGLSRMIRLGATSGGAFPLAQVFMDAVPAYLKAEHKGILPFAAGSMKATAKSAAYQFIKITQGQKAAEQAYPILAHFLETGGGFTTELNYSDASIATYFDKKRREGQKGMGLQFPPLKTQSDAWHMYANAARTVKAFMLFGSETLDPMYKFDTFQNKLMERTGLTVPQLEALFRYQMDPSTTKTVPAGIDPKKFGDALQIIEDATHDAKATALEGTLAYTKQGTFAGSWNKITPFFNAVIRSYADDWRTLNLNPKQSVQRLAMIGLAQAAYWWWTKDEPWRKDAPTWLKNQSWLFKVPGTDIMLAIPKPGGFTGMFINGVDASLESLHEKGVSTDFFGDVGGRGLEGVGFNALFQRFGPAFTTMAVNVYANQDWTGRPVVTESMEHKPPFLRRDKKTTPLDEVFGAAIRAVPGFDQTAPATVAQVTSGATAGWFPTLNYAAQSLGVLGGGEMPGGKSPIVGRFIVQQERSQAIDDFYRERKRLEQEAYTDSVAKEKLKSLDETAKILKAFGTEIADGASLRERQSVDRTRASIARHSIGQESDPDFPNPWQNSTLSKWSRDQRDQSMLSPGFREMRATIANHADRLARPMPIGKGKAALDSWNATVSAEKAWFAERGISPEAVRAALQEQAWESRTNESPLSVASKIQRARTRLPK